MRQYRSARRHRHARHRRSSTGAIYLDAATDASPGVRHLIYALSLKDGSLLPGWPVNVADALKRAGQTFAPLVQNQRGALTILNGMLYTPFGGHAGDCGDYHGVVVGVSISNPRIVRSWRTRARGAAVWRPAESARMENRSSSPPATRLTPRHGATARPSSALRPTCIDPTIKGISSRRRIGRPWTIATPTSAAQIRFRWMPPRRQAIRR